LIHHEPEEFWSEASGNQDALNECYQFMERQCNASEEGATSARREVTFVVGVPGCGATALANELSRKLRATGHRVLAMDRISAMEPGSFKANLDAALRIPPDIGNTPWSSSLGLNDLELAVLKARNYECVIVHDVDVYGSDDTAQSANAAAIIMLLRASHAAKFVLFGNTNLVKWLLVALTSASVECKTIKLHPMRANSKFGQFIISVAQSVQPPYPLDHIETLSVGAMHQKSRGKIGLAIRILKDKIAEELSAQTVVGGELPAMWGCDDEECSIFHRRQAAGESAVSAETWSASKRPRRAGGRSKIPRSVKGGLCDVTCPSQHSTLTESGHLYVLSAVDNESFSSWIARQSIGPSHSIGHSLGDYMVLHCSKGGSDPDMQWCNLELLQSLSLSDRIYISAHFALPCPGSSNRSQISSTAGMIPYSKALYYCAECFKVDVAAGLAPAMRLDWRRPRMSVCLRHDRPVLLGRLATSTFTILDKAWRAFAEYAASPASRLVTQFPLQHSSSTQAKADNELLLTLVARIQTWFFGLTADTNPSANAAEFLMAYWLQDPNGNGAQGFARCYFFNRLTRPQGLTNNLNGRIFFKLKPDSARPRDLAVAYWMLGVGFGIINASEARFIRDTTRPYSLPFPISRSEVSLLGGLAFCKSQRVTLSELAKSTLISSDYDCIAWAFQV
jgi:hypothetical protein